MKDYKPFSNDMLENKKKKEMDKHGVPPTKGFIFITESFSLTRSHNLVVHGECVKVRSNIGRNVTSKIVLHTVTIHLEIQTIRLRQLNSTVRKDTGGGERARPTESLLNRDILIDSSPKIDSLLGEFAGELILLKSIPPGIDEADCDLEEEILLIEKLLYDNSSPQFDLSLTPDNSMPPGIEDDDYDSEGDILILKEFLSNDSLSLPENESFHFDIPSSPCSLAKPSDDDEIKPNSVILTVKVVGDISEHYVPIPRLLPTQPTLASNQEKSPHLLSHRVLKAFQLSSESPTMIYGGNIPILDVPFLHFYPP
uniref:Uncharacterized protein n=1 Tax=Tanacetum cinerariifolium TaxID=118510 RepID=A0A6L2KEP8_TANCI|nr:hypothetical protein [Tanacetum cinerariifolium]